MTTKRIEDLRRFLAQSPKDAFINYALGIELVNSASDPEALVFFEYLLNDHPTYVPTYLHAGQLFERMGEIARARLVYEKGIEQATASGNDHAARELAGALSMLDAMHSE